MADPTMPEAAQFTGHVKQDAMREQLSKIEDNVLDAFASMAVGLDRNEGARWLSIARTHIQQGFMCAKRALYEGKRVGDA
jgi:hypothetical protein